jgi:hypothetical protein
MAFTNSHYIWTNHVKTRMKERRIPESYMTKTLNDPDRVVHNHGAIELHKHIEGRTVAAIIKKNERGEQILVSCWINPPFAGTKDARRKERYHEMKKASIWKKLWLTALDQLGL